MKQLFIFVVTALLIGASAGCAGTHGNNGPTRESTGEYIDDSAITARVKTALLHDIGTKSTDIQVETYRGVVQLSGFVDSHEMAERAVERTQQVPGVKSVKDDMHTKPRS